jgi:hypothetical protein
MIKSNDSTEFEDGNVSLLNLSKIGLEKIAAYSEITDFLQTLKPIPNRSYLHVNMLGSSEIYGPTKNGDFFSTDTLERFHKTFQTTPAKFFKHHQNKSHSPSFGVVIFATFNPIMKRIELIVEADEATSKELDALMSRGIYPKTSMACRLPHDRCSICGNIAKTRQEYCKHLMFEMGKLYPDGRRVAAINEDSITWFDCSWVVRPADPTSSVLTKVAEEHVLGAAERAELEGFTNKKASIRKWSELIKEITEEGEVLGHASSILERTRDLPTHLTDILAHYDLNQSLTAMAVLGISPSISFLAELIAKIHLGDGYEGIGPLVEEYVHHVPADTMAPAIDLESPMEPIDPMLLSALVPYVAGSSLLTSSVEKRASGVGYAHNGPHIEPTYQEELAAARALQPRAEDFEISYGKLLLGLGASALLAKYFISSEIEKRIREERNLHLPQNYVKIGLMKRADYKVASSLSKAAMAPYNAYTLQKQREDDGPTHGQISMARKLLKSTRTAIGGKLATMLKAVGLGQKVKETVTNSVQ